MAGKSKEKCVYYIVADYKDPFTGRPTRSSPYHSTDRKKADAKMKKLRGSSDLYKYKIERVCTHE